MKNLKRLFLITILLVSIQCGLKAKQLSPLVDTIEVYSNKMDRKIENLVILPANYSKESSTKYPVVYLLHGHGGNHTSWSNIKDLNAEATRWEIIIVCPNGENSWYWDSPVRKVSQFETYVSKELINYIDSNYKTIASPEARAISGYSMGGHGGLWLGINHPDVFGACGSLSGGVDIRPFPNNWNMKDELGTYKENSQRWDNYTVITQLDKIKKPNTLAIIIDCGFGDFFFQVNENLHKNMLEKKIDHDYLTRPGGHTGEYWGNAIDYQLQFFHKFFKKIQAK